MRDAHKEPTLGSKVYQNVLRQILSGVLQPGQPMSRRRIATEMRTSLLPAAHALQRLEFEGLLESRPRAGTRVRTPSREDIVGHFVVREALEVQAAVRASRMATAIELAHLEALARALDAAAQRMDARRYSDLHREFHRQIAEYSRCGALHDSVDQCHAFAALWLAHVPQPSGFPAHHLELVEAISSRDPVRAAAAVQGHLAVGIARAMKLFEPSPKKSEKRTRRPFRRRRRKPSPICQEP